MIIKNSSKDKNNLWIVKKSVSKTSKLIWFGSPYLFAIHKYILSQKKGKVLDAGCGTGKYTMYIAEKGFRCWGIDKNKNRIKISKQLCKQKSLDVKFSYGDVQKLDFPNNYFDYIICFDLLEHVPNMKRTLNEFSRVLKPNGKLILEAETSDRYGKKAKQSYDENDTIICRFSTLELLNNISSIFKIHKYYTFGFFRSFYIGDIILNKAYKISFLSFLKIIETLVGLIFKPKSINAFIIAQKSKE